ncbi:PQQ-dependent sugar dehydrogenase [Aeromicrobium endophyticum]|uniref:PQQ-dependent sugar dehydrogenase n=1 Tax=Aeromicrobium endophyticum TaxID=2292704 RepID=A0A371P1V8_9ACTN|nr:PQQ-dependent sugar dehydrogenase [Aeromicrobium endophyticum]REK69927.1 PQQ-dependent sugar dehydrogenase [Aeromicrobium endophyticum]
MQRRELLSGMAVLGAAALVGCSRSSEGEPAPRTTGTASSATAPTDAPPTGTPTSAAPVTPTIASTVASGLAVPWGIAFLPSGDALVSQRDDGTIVRIGADGTVAPLGEVPGARGRAGGEGGLLGLALSPDDDGVLFAYVSTSTDNRVVRMTLTGDTLGSPDAVLTGIPVGARHHGGRLLFAPDGTLFVSTGDAGNGRLAQDRDSLAGKILRIDQDGAPHPDNPFGNRTWSYGHRNVEGLAFDAGGRLWATEFGDKSADELNVSRRGQNYGWPRVEGTGGGRGLVDPKVTWPTDEASPAGIAIVDQVAYVGALQGECLFAVPLDGGSAGTPVAYFAGDYGRVRSVAAAPDGSVWVTTSNTDGRGDPRRADDRILRITV